MFCLLVSLMLGGAVAAGVDSVLQFESVEGLGWKLERVRIELSSDEASAGGALFIGGLHAPAAQRPIQNLQIHCRRLRISRTRFFCGQGRFQIAGRRIADIGELALHHEEQAWTLRGNLQHMAVGELNPLLQVLLPDWPVATAAGMAQLQIELAGTDAGAVGGSLRLRVSDLGLATADSLLASEGLAGHIDLRFAQDPDGSDVSLNSELRAGYAYVDPVLHNYTQHPARLRLSGRWSPDTGRLHLNSLDWQQNDVIALQARGSLRPGPESALEDLHVVVAAATLPGLYSQFLEPYLAGTPLDQLDTAGSLHGRIRLEGGLLTDLHLELRELHVDDRQRRFAIYGLDGQLHWRASSTAELSALAWDGIYLGRMPFGRARWQFRTHGAEFTGAQPLRLSFFDGAITVDRFRASALDSGEPQVTFEAMLEPVSLSLFTSALGLPSFPGKIAGRLPPVEFSNRQLRVAGDLTAEAFGGALTISELVVDEPLGLVPRASASIRLRRLDLTQLTSVFDFGHIRGELDADVSNLELQAWRPTAFAARIYTSPGSTAAQQISQRAVNSISRVGGGGAVAALSSSFLRYFENFAYRRIGWSCVLRNGVCEMGGARPAKNDLGYIIVEGRGLPRINVVGHARRVSWNTLVTQLQGISRGDPPSVK